MHLTHAEVTDLLARATGTALGGLDYEERNDGQLLELIAALREHVPNPEDILYIPGPELRLAISRYKASGSFKSQKEKGDLVEQVAYLVFQSVQGWDNIKSFSSYDAQHDLVVSGSSATWKEFLDSILIPKNRRTIVIEAKYHKERVPAKDFTRLCHILENKFNRQSDLGIFFCHKGASGFDKTLVLTNSRAAQVIFHAKTKKYVVVFDGDDIHKLDQPGSFIRLLRAKIEDVENGAGIHFHKLDGEISWKQIQMPPHLAQYTRVSDTAKPTGKFANDAKAASI